MEVRLQRLSYTLKKFEMPLDRSPGTSKYTHEEKPREPRRLPGLKACAEHHCFPMAELATQTPLRNWRLLQERSWRLDAQGFQRSLQASDLCGAACRPLLVSFGLRDTLTVECAQVLHYSIELFFCCSTIGRQRSRR